MTLKVVDASAPAALLFGEPETEAVAVRLEGSSLFAPALLGYEIASVCLKKLRRNPKLRDAMLAAFALYALMPIEIVDIEHADALQLAEVVGLTICDAAYLWLARSCLPSS
jgi:predicted nucleic acid-binding protein